MKRFACLLFAALLLISTLSWASAESLYLSEPYMIYDVCSNFTHSYYFTGDGKIWTRHNHSEKPATVLADFANLNDQAGIEYYEYFWNHSRLVCDDTTLYLLYPHNGTLYKITEDGRMEKVVTLDFSGLTKPWGSNEHFAIIQKLVMLDDVLYASMITPGDDFTTTDFSDKHMYVFSMKTGQRIDLDFFQEDMTNSASDAHEHSPGYWWELTAPTCNAPGLEETYCQDINCSKHMVRYVDPLNVHSYAPATCFKPATCRWCGATSGEALGHFIAPATCRSYPQCLRCSITFYDEGLGKHVFSEATCLHFATCPVCTVTIDRLADHSYDAEGHCTVCGKAAMENE